MRTTITLDDSLLAQLKQHAAESRTSVSRLIEQGARLVVQPPSVADDGDPFELVTFGVGGRFSRYNIDKASALVEAEDAERFTAGR